MFLPPNTQIVYTFIHLTFVNVRWSRSPFDFVVDLALGA